MIYNEEPVSLLPPPNEAAAEGAVAFADTSITAATKRMLELQAGIEWIGQKHVINTELDSIYEVAASRNQSLVAFVQEDPEYALQVAETCLAKWTNVFSQAALTGSISTSEGETRLTREQTRILDKRVAQAREDVAAIRDLVSVAAYKHENKRDHIIRTLYTNAILKHDTKALIYLLDRVEGRPGEARIAELDYDNAYNVYMIIHTLFDRQLQVLNAGNGIIIVCCSRRAGKTHLCVATALIECLRKPNTTCMYIGETAELTEGLVEDEMNKIIDACHLQDKKGKRFNWRHMDNNSKLMVRGLSSIKDLDQIRGKGAKVIVMDEFFHLKSNLLEYFQREVLEPMQMDYADDYKFLCVGTPPAIKGTFGEHAWRTWNVPHFTWTWRDNPHPVDIKAREEYVQHIIDEKGLSWDTPFIKREYLGEWAYEEDLVLYPNAVTYDPDEALPSWPISRIFFGLDYGVSDNDALIGIAWSDDAGSGYEFYSVKFNRLDIKDQKVSQLEYLKQQVEYGWDLALSMFPNLPIKEANKRIFWDADDNDQHLTEEIAMHVTKEYMDDGGKKKTIGIAIQNAHKTDKKLMWDKIDELMRTGRLLLIKDGPTAHECGSTILLRGPNGEIYSDIDEKAYHPDLLPAMRYALYNVLGV